MKKEKRWRYALWIAVLMILGLTFFFSSQDGTNSGKMSGTITETVIKIIRPDYDTLPESEQQALFDTVHFFVRKTAHFSEYAFLGFMIRLLCETYALRCSSFIAWLCGTGYAATDELHQWFVAARAAMWQDVCIDSAGALAGVLLAAGIVILTKRLHRKQKRRETIAAD